MSSTPGRSGSRYIRDVLMPSSNSSLRARSSAVSVAVAVLDGAVATPSRSSPCRAGRRGRAACRRPTRRCRPATSRTSRSPRRRRAPGRRRAGSARRRRPRCACRAARASSAHSTHRRELRAADAGHHPGRAHRAGPDADLDDVGAGLDQLARAVGGDDVAGDDRRVRGDARAPPRRRASVRVWWPWAVSMTSTSTPIAAQRLGLASTGSPLMPTATAIISRPSASTAGR